MSEQNLAVVHIIAGARPNFMKVAPLFHALKAENCCRPVLVHTGQHYDVNMSDAFFSDLQLPEPDHHLEVGSGTHAEQTGRVMIAYEKICFEQRPDWIVVVGDINSTVACALVAAKLCIPVAHLEAGLRSGDLTMPEEINRIVTDSIANLLWTPSPDGDAHLKAAGVDDSRIDRVGNIMLDAYEMLRGKIEAAATYEKLDLTPGQYGVVTLHRPSNVDDPAKLKTLVERISSAAQRCDLVFAAHPRTRQKLNDFDLMTSLSNAKGVHLVDPMGYVEFMGLVRKAKLVITDSGGIQEETTYLDIPCITVRDNTERPITITDGTNRLTAPDAVEAAVDQVLEGEWPKAKTIEMWDGKTAGRVVASLKSRLH
ncbi:non-hydrolyzing UDP-N-acetylglucosamine 2-epimerase [Pelagibius sp. Alg239-R121]|uniref:non-hydrolyzing UDP-N-acetylglucosamine 2-epimerase n=1 Tax=Pelagibius sp. Alg239-R121 TaxID=2993448 RepID=UPI0024A6D16D|nr:UDP-N-acetylglucosamine 2-epimerase (non-hydrolyzing) [Pelagibius sp. Alg239-R121]